MKKKLGRWAVTLAVFCIAFVWNVTAVTALLFQNSLTLGDSLRAIGDEIGESAIRGPILTVIVYGPPILASWLAWKLLEMTDRWKD